MWAKSAFSLSTFSLHKWKKYMIKNVGRIKEQKLPRVTPPDKVETQMYLSKRYRLRHQSNMCHPKNNNRSFGYQYVGRLPGWSTLLSSYLNCYRYASFTKSGTFVGHWNWNSAFPSVILCSNKANWFYSLNSVHTDCRCFYKSFFRNWNIFSRRGFGVYLLNSQLPANRLGLGAGKV